MLFCSDSCLGERPQVASKSVCSLIVLFRQLLLVLPLEIGCSVSFKGRQDGKSGLQIL